MDMCRYLICPSHGVIFNPYTALPRHKITTMVQSLGARMGTKVSPRVLRASFCTNLIMEAALAHVAAEMKYISTTGGWTLGSNEPMNSYCSNRALAANLAHKV